MAILLSNKIVLFYAYQVAEFQHNGRVQVKIQRIVNGVQSYLHMIARR